MILTCPQCATRYQTDAALFPADGRKVRCGKCGHVWHQEAPEPEAEIGTSGTAPARPAASVPETIAPGNADRGAEAAAAELATAPPSAGLGERLATAIGWLGLAAILALIAWSTVAYREAIASAWPQSSAFYDAIGLPVNASGIAITNVKSSHDVANGQLVLIVSGDLVNITGRAIHVPVMRVTLSDRSERQLDGWDFSAGAKMLQPGQKVVFTTRHANPPASTQNLKVMFAEGGG